MNLFRKKVAKTYNYFVSYVVKRGSEFDFQNTVILAKEQLVTIEDIRFVEDLIKRENNPEETVTIVGINLLGTAPTKVREKG